MVRQHLLNSVAWKFKHPVREISRQLKFLSGKANAAEVTEKAHKIDTAVDDIEQLVTNLLLSEKKQRRDYGPPVEAPLSPEGRVAVRHRFKSDVMKFIGRMCIGILTVLMLHQLFMIGVSQVAYNYLNTDPAWYPVRTMAALIVRTVHHSDRETLPDLLDSLRETLDRRIDLLSANSENSLTRTDPLNFAGQMIYGKYNGSDVFCAPVLGETLSLLIDPGY
jgi:hypothetical protein